MPLDELTVEDFAIEPEAVWPVEDARLEPMFLDGPMWIEFEESPQPGVRPFPWEEEDEFLVAFEEFADAAELDPERLEEPVDETPAGAPQRRSATGLFGSLGIHLAVLLVLLGWSRPTADIAPSIPVQLVIEASAPPGPTPPDSNLPPAEMLPKPNTEPPKPPMQTANEAVRPRQEPQPRPKPKPVPAPPPPPKVAAVSPPKPAPPPPPKIVAVSPPKPAPPPRREEVAAREPEPVRVEAPRPMPLPAPAVYPTPAPPVYPTAAPAVYAPPQLRREVVPASAPPVVRSPGTDETKGDYYETLRRLTHQHIDMLATGFLGGRRGTTVLRIGVMRDGTITGISLAEGSGYPDIDARIEQMVSAVGRFPPLPAAFQGPSADLQLKLMFPDALAQ